MYCTWRWGPSHQYSAVAFLLMCVGSWQYPCRHVCELPLQINSALSKKMSAPSKCTFWNSLVIFNWHLHLTFWMRSPIVKPEQLESLLYTYTHHTHISCTTLPTELMSMQWEWSGDITHAFSSNLRYGLMWRQVAALDLLIRSVGGGRKKKMTVIHWKACWFPFDWPL